VVVEAGTYYGRDTATFAKLADRVLSFEPSPRNYEIARKNLRRFSNVELYNMGIWDEDGELELMYGTDSSDDTFIEPDTGHTSISHRVPAYKVASLPGEFNIDGIDFLKIEAEGGEPEVISSIGEMSIKTIVVRCGEERFGESPEDEVVSLLENKGYEIVDKKHEKIFAVPRDLSSSVHNQ